MSSLPLPLEEDAPSGFLAWFPYGRQDLPGWRFDVITLLAIIGESSVAEHAQTLTASRLCLLPRIIPAPQALLKPARPQRLPETNAKMVGVYGGVVLDTVGFFANILHPLDEMKAFSFRVLEIKHTEEALKALQAGKPEKPTMTTPKKGGDSWWRMWRMRQAGHTTSSVNTTIHHQTTSPRGGLFDPDPANPSEKPKRKTTTVQFITTDNDLERGSSSNSPTLHSPPNHNRHHHLHIPRTTTIKPSVPATFYSPVHLLSLLSFALTLAIIILSALWEDGTAILATVLISLASSVVCYASLWQPVLMNRTTNSKVPKGDVVIRTREGAFLLIKCTEEVARELYSGTEECRYVVKSDVYRVYMGLGMVLLMVSVVLLGNCGWNSQVLIGGGYICLNGLYWMMGLVKEERFWDLGKRYTMRDVTPEDAKWAHVVPDEHEREHEMTNNGGRWDMKSDNRKKEGQERGHDDDTVPSFTRTMWYAIRETEGQVAWVKRSGAMPKTKQWKKWLEEARDMAKRGEKGWKAVRRKNEIMKEEGAEENAEQMAPAQEVQRKGTIQA
ncbi:hypothetical protein QBC36DRAFT_37324 [Triangularia setosa]|uniref:Uncharacterized protein n=1 Tax=Triangularia setosa TaxID=2587417 RepID=A0AAN7ABF6_9PEZI|nr:hypothetical protein QBC36DRAFT_37324 [Podospora setosa]